ELVKIRASQLNGCSYCIYMHTKAAREIGESEERLYLLSSTLAISGRWFGSAEAAKRTMR
ncbi:carboxymuconolactone decarboxylase family protein, partial [Kribbella swartbergensis]